MKRRVPVDMMAVIKSLEGQAQGLPGEPTFEVRTYILDDDGNPVPEPDMIKSGRWLEENLHRRVVARSVIAADGTDMGDLKDWPHDDPGLATVSTVFLWLDHGWHGVPQLYETLVFGGEMDQEMDRYETREEALLGHAATVIGVQAAHGKAWESGKGEA